MTETAAATGASPAKPSAMKWVLLGGLGCLLLAILGAGGCIASVFWALDKSKNSAIYKQALAETQKSPGAQALLGTPIEGGMPTQFHMNYSNGMESGTLVFGVSGPKGAGTVSVAGAYGKDAWVFTTFTISASGKSVDVLAEQGSPPATPLPAEQPPAPEEKQ